VLQVQYAVKWWCGGAVKARSSKIGALQSVISSKKVGTARARSGKIDPLQMQYPVKLGYCKCNIQ
jgi:hypothetical protein